MGEDCRVVITGIGLVTPLGSRLDEFWTGLVEGRSGVGQINRFDASGLPTTIAAEVRSFQQLDPHFQSPFSEHERIEQYAFSATWLALGDAGLADGATPLSNAGLVLASGLGTYGHREFFIPCGAAMSPEGTFDISRFARHYGKTVEKDAAERRSPGNLAARLALRHDIQGPVLSVMTACAAGTQALGDALRWIRDGRTPLVVAGGSDSEIYPMGLASFCLLRALSTRNSAPEHASRPFDADRDGFVLGEGASVLILERLSHAQSRGARIYAEVTGFGTACDAFRVTDPHPDGRGAVLAMKRAIQDGGITPQQVGYINAHGTSTRLNDRAETRAVREVFGDTPPPISSTKSMIGHLTVAAGALEAAVTALSLSSQTLHPTINYNCPDPECDLDYVTEGARNHSFEYALSNSFAFGGQCASLLLKRYSG